MVEEIQQPPGERSTVDDQLCATECRDSGAVGRARPVPKGALPTPFWSPAVSQNPGWDEYAESSSQHTH